MSHTLHLPWVANNAVITGTGEPYGFAGQVFALMRDDPLQRRFVCQWNDRLATLAWSMAEDMGHRDYYDHIDPDGHGPNWRVRAAGWVLPDWYNKWDTANSIQSIAATQQTAADVYRDWMKDDAHRNHLLGIGPVFSAQTQIGCGYASVEGSRYTRYWVVLSAPPEENL